ncbi:oxygenase MpaB family protein [Nocardiopsis ganjiahuensis]|uniref:oxygenase MpaB family protein n=1 Tax=Nocardiopsis ganjiahuensis TaxID=239984 RepID=UPI000348588F|nr:oxygenase MpaB family protein [Nocardiopsis ganjiahuensis]
MDRSSDESTFRRVNAEASLLGGAGYAVLLQIAHPSVARGVAEHSDFASRPLDRLRGTLYYVYGTAHGTEEERERVHSIVRAVHRKVRGPGYDALDPELLLWVAATLHRSAVRLYELTVADLSAEEREGFLREAAVYATALGLPPEQWPRNPAEFDAYWERASERLEVGPQARELARELFRPNNRLLWPLTLTQRFLSGGLLTPELRREFEIPWSRAHQRRFDRLMRLTRAVYPRLPKTVRSLPATLYMRSLRKNKGWKPVKPSGRPAKGGRNGRGGGHGSRVS